jgi:hypothetical protein
MSATVLRKKRRRDSSPFADNYELEKIKDNIINGKPLNYMALSTKELQNKLNDMYQDGDVSEETYNFLSDVIDDSKIILKYEERDITEQEEEID